MCKSLWFTFVLFLYVEEFSSADVLQMTFTLKLNGTDVRYEYHLGATWRQAVERCAGAGGELLAPRDEAEAGAVMAALEGVLAGWWIWTSIADLNNTGVYRAPDGRPLSELHHKWYVGQPDSVGGNFRCVLLQREALLYVGRCDWTSPYVCKFPAAGEGTTPALNTAPTAPTAQPAMQNDAPSLIGNDPRKPDTTFTIKTNGVDTTYVFHVERVTWRQARQQCAGAGARLWTPGGEAEQRAVRGEMDRYAIAWNTWTGINDLDTSGAFQTFDGRPLNMSNYKWDADNGKSWGDAWHCVIQLPDSSLYVIDCNWPTSYVCERDGRAPSTPPPLELNDAPAQLDKTFKLKSNGVDIQYVYHSEWVTWHQAKERCAGAGAQLLVPEDEGEARAVRREVNPLEPFWWIWVGVHDFYTSGVYQTLDGRNLTAVHHEWRGGSPDSLGGTLHCVGLLPDSLLFAAGCDKRFPYVCKFLRVN